MRPTRGAIVAVLFLISGRLTFQLYVSGEHSSHAHDFFTDTWYSLRTGLPFAAVSAGLWARPFGWIPLIAFLDTLAWFVAYFGAIALGPRVGIFIAMGFAGLAGALGVTLSTGLGCRRLWSSKWLIRAAVAGALAGIPFGLASTGTPNNDVLIWTFPLWQMVLGCGFYLTMDTPVGK